MLSLFTVFEQGMLRKLVTCVPVAWNCFLLVDVWPQLGRWYALNQSRDLEAICIMYNGTSHRFFRILDHFWQACRPEKLTSQLHRDKESSLWVDECDTQQPGLNAHGEITSHHFEQRELTSIATRCYQLGQDMHVWASKAAYLSSMMCVRFWGDQTQLTWDFHY